MLRLRFLLDKEIFGEKSIAHQYEIHYKKFKEKEAEDKKIEKEKVLKENLLEIEKERNNFTFENPRHILILKDKIKYAMTGDSVDIENENIPEALEKLRKIVAEKIIR